MKIDNEIKLDFSDVLIKPKRSVMASRKDVVLERNFKFYHSNREWSGVPIFAANMDCVGVFQIANKLSRSKLCTAIHKHYALSELLAEREIFNDYTWYSLGITNSDFNKLEDFIRYSDAPSPNLVVDVANGYSEAFCGHINRIRELCPESIIMAGNVCTDEMTQQLILAGADIVKVGIGPGGVCATRRVTGVGYPQLSAIAECSDAAHGLKSGDKRIGLICCDGGIRYPGDFGKAFGAGSDFIMCGTYFAGASECIGEWEYNKELQQYWNSKGTQFASQYVQTTKKRLKFYGMSSYDAQVKHDGVKSYRASEGDVIWIDHKGPIDMIVDEILGGLRSTCTYVGSNCLKDLSKCTTFIRCNRIRE